MTDASARMAYLVADTPPVEVLVDARFLRGPGASGWEPGFWASIKSQVGRALLFETYLDAWGALYDKLPIHAFRWRAGESGLPLHALQIWDGLSHHLAVIEKRSLKGCAVSAWLGDGSRMGGTYLFTVDQCDGVGDVSGWASVPAEHKAYNVVALDNGQFAALPNNRLRFALPSRGNARIGDPPGLVASTTAWSCESHALSAGPAWDYGDAPPAD